MGSILSGGRDKAAERAAQKSRELQQIANDRQLAALQTSDENTNVSRRNPRGRKLFAEDTSTAKTTLS